MAWGGLRTELDISLDDLNRTDRPDFEQIQRFLSLAREARVPCPELVYRFGTDALQRFSKRMTPDELWGLREEVAIAAMHMGKTAEAEDLVMSIRNKFPESSRASKLLALHFESTGDFEEAKKLYAKELEVNPQNTAFLRRMAAVKKAQGDLVGAAEALRMLLATNQTDYASWEEAAALYLRMGAMSQGIFCLEEVLMHQPGNIAAQMLLADTLYATGGVANWKAARGYYAGLLEATGGSSVRALWGVCSCMAQLKANQGKGSSSTSPEDDDGAALAYAAAEALVQAYAEAGGGEKLELAKEVLKSQSLLSTL